MFADHEMTAAEERILCLALADRIDTVAERYRDAMRRGAYWDRVYARTELERTIAMYHQVDYDSSAYLTLVDRIASGDY